MSKVSTLNPNAKKWLRALRSGLFKQGTNYLASSNNNGEIGHCCLGVACELAILDGVDISKEIIKHPDKTVIKYDNTVAGLPKPVQDWLGLKFDMGQFDSLKTGSRSIPSDHRYYHLAEMNDKGWTFDEIAEIVELNPDALFCS